jgi:hypothetical protein
MSIFHEITMEYIENGYLSVNTYKRFLDFSSIVLKENDKIVYVFLDDLNRFEKNMGVTVEEMYQKGENK